MNVNALGAILLIPAISAALLAILPGYRLTAKLNVVAALATFLTSLSLFVVEPTSGQYLLLDDLNKIFIVLTTFVGFTTSVFSASYIHHEIEIGRLTPAFLRFYHAMYQALMLYRRRDIKRMFAYSSIEHMGIIVFAFGMGGPLANFAGLLHMTMHSLTKSAIFFAVGHIAQVKGTQKIADIGGLTVTNPVLGWGLMLGVIAIVGLPPLGIFMSEFLVVSSTFSRAPWLTAILVLGIIIALGGLFLRIGAVMFGEPRGKTAPAEASYMPMFTHLALVLMAGIYLPPVLVTGFTNVAKLLG